MACDAGLSWFFDFSLFFLLHTGLPLELATLKIEGVHFTVARCPLP